MSEGDFRRRAEPAFTHPATISALGVLMLNGLLFNASCGRRRGVSATGVLRLRLAVLMAGVASLAGMACVVHGNEVGVVRLGVADDGAIVAMTYEEDYSRRGRPASGYYSSLDGGLTWKSLGELATSSRPDSDLAQWHDRQDVSADTPRGTYTLDGPDVVVLHPDGRRRVTYSTGYLSQDGNVWTQQGATTGHSDGRTLADTPNDLIYDKKSGNLVLALGIQGVVVGTPDDEWVVTGVDRFRPTDFSFVTKTGMLLTHVGFWITALTLAFSMTAAGLVLSQYRVAKLFLLTLAALVVCLAMVIGIIALVALIATFNSELAFLIGILSPAAIVVGALAFGLRPRLLPVRDIFLIMAALVSVLASVVLLLNFGRTNDSSPIVVSMWFVVLAWALGLPCLTRLMDELTDLSPVAWSMAGMTGLVALTFMLWLHLGISHGIAVLSTLALCGAAAIVLAAYVRRDQRLRKAMWEARTRSISK